MNENDKNQNPSDELAGMDSLSYQRIDLGSGEGIGVEAQS